MSLPTYYFSYDKICAAEVLIYPRCTTFVFAYRPSDYCLVLELGFGGVPCSRSPRLSESYRNISFLGTRKGTTIRLR